MLMASRANNEDGTEQCLNPLIGRIRVRHGVAAASSLFSPSWSASFSAAG